MLTDTDLTELERLCKAREGQRFAGLVLELLAAYRAERARAASEWERAWHAEQAARAAREEAERLREVILRQVRAQCRYCDKDIPYDDGRHWINRKRWELCEATGMRAALAASARRGEG